MQSAYTLWAPFYDAVVGALTRRARCESLRALGDVSGQRILLAGVGTGLDLPYLPPKADYIGLDLTSAMLARALAKARRLRLHVDLSLGNAQALPFRDASFDRVILHLILAVAANPVLALREASRVVRPGGTVHILDKFLRPGQRAPIRRIVSPWLAPIVTKTDVVFEDVLADTPNLQLVSDTPAMVAGWFRRIVLRRPR